MTRLSADARADEKSLTVLAISHRRTGVGFDREGAAHGGGELRQELDLDGGAARRRVEDALGDGDQRRRQAGDLGRRLPFAVWHRLSAATPICDSAPRMVVLSSRVAVFGSIRSRWV